SPPSSELMNIVLPSLTPLTATSRKTTWGRACAVAGSACGLPAQRRPSPPTPSQYPSAAVSRLPETLPAVHPVSSPPHSHHPLVLKVMSIERTSLVTLPSLTHLQSSPFPALPLAACQVRS